MLHRSVEARRTAADLFGCLMRAEFSAERATAIARREFPSHLRMAGVPGSSDDDVSGGSSFATALSGAIIASLEHGGGIYDTIAAASRRAQFRVPYFVGAQPVVAEIVAEGVAVPVARFSVNRAGLTPRKAAGLIVQTQEALSTQQGLQGAVDELREAITLATDTSFLSGLAGTAGITTVPGTSDIMSDFAGLLAAVNRTGYGTLFFVLSPSMANSLSTLRDEGGFLFPDLGPQGGEILRVQALVSAGAGDSIFLIDAGSILTGDEQIEIRRSTSASIELDDSPTAASTTPAAATANVVSLFQADAIALLGIRHFAALALRTSGVAVLDLAETT